MGLMAGVGCGVSPRSSDSGMEALSPIQLRQSVSPNKIVMGRCELLGLNIPVLDGSQIIQGSTSISNLLGYNIEGRQCRAGSTVALRFPVPVRTSPAALMEALLRNQGVKHLPVSEGIQMFSVSGGTPDQQVGAMVFQGEGYVYRVVAIPPANMSGGDWKDYWARIVKDTRVAH